MTQFDRDRVTVEKYARQLNATIYWDATPSASHNGPRADPLTGDVHLAPWGSDNLGAGASLWVSMHELGHIATTKPFEIMKARLSGQGHSNELAEIEATAWLWGIQRAGRDLDETGRAEIIGALSSYFQAGPFATYVIGTPGPKLTELLKLVGPTSSTPISLIQQSEPRYWPDAVRLWDEAYEHTKALAA